MSSRKKTPKFTIRPAGGTAWAYARNLRAARKAARQAVDAGLQGVMIVDRDGQRHPIFAV